MALKKVVLVMLFTLAALVRLRSAGASRRPACSGR